MSCQDGATLHCEVIAEKFRQACYGGERECFVGVGGWICDRGKDDDDELTFYAVPPPGFTFSSWLLKRAAESCAALRLRSAGVVWL